MSNPVSTHSWCTVDVSLTHHLSTMYPSLSTKLSMHLLSIVDPSSTCTHIFGCAKNNSSKASILDGNKDVWINSNVKFDTFVQFHFCLHVWCNTKSQNDTNFWYVTHCHGILYGSIADPLLVHRWFIVDLSLTLLVKRNNIFGWDYN